MFSRFYRPLPFGLPFCARPGRKKYRSRARMIFPSGQPAGPPCSKRSGNPIPLPPKSGKTALLSDTKKCRPFQACIPVPFRSFILRKAHRFGRCRPPAGWPGFLPVPGSRIFPPAPFPLLPAGLPSPLSVPYPQSSCRGWSRR